MDFRSRLHVKGVISGVAHDVDADYIPEEVGEVIGASQLTCMVD
jgi:hypothetical protein